VNHFDGQSIRHIRPHSQSRFFQINMRLFAAWTWTGYYFWAGMGFHNADVEEFEAWARAMNRDEVTLDELMQTEEGRKLWKEAGFTWIGDFLFSPGLLFYLNAGARNQRAEDTFFLQHHVFGICQFADFQRLSHSAKAFFGAISFQLWINSAFNCFLPIFFRLVNT
jgi:hypothetical protein